MLIPVSALAEDRIADGLAARGIRSRRVDTYTTVPAAWAPLDFERARAAQLVAFGSPSAVRVWAERVGVDAAAVCIGDETKAEALKCGFGQVTAPPSSRNRKLQLESWAACCADAVKGTQGRSPSDAAEQGSPVVRSSPPPPLMVLVHGMQCHW